jgi:Myosin N-terminal SH3-like domain
MPDQVVLVVHTVGSKVWVRDTTEAWVKADVLRLEGDHLVVKTEQNKEVKCKAAGSPLQNQDARGVEVQHRNCP